MVWVGRAGICLLNKTTFGLLLGAVAVAAALSFGLGGREIAARKLKEWLQSMESRNIERKENRNTQNEMDTP